MNSVGRPTVMDEATLHKLETAFLNGATDKEAIFQAAISSSTFYDYCKENPEFAERKEQLKDQVKYRARQNIVKAIEEGDKSLSQWYLERKVKNEFAQRTEHTGEEGGPIELENSDRIKELAELLRKASHEQTILPKGE